LPPAVAQRPAAAWPPHAGSQAQRGPAAPGRFGFAVVDAKRYL
jgi:hypothetical protein